MKQQSCFAPPLRDQGANQLSSINQTQSINSCLVNRSTDELGFDRCGVSRNRWDPFWIESADVRFKVVFLLLLSVIGQRINNRSSDSLDIRRGDQCVRGFPRMPFHTHTPPSHWEYLNGLVPDLQPPADAHRTRRQTPLAMS